MAQNRPLFKAALAALTLMSVLPAAQAQFSTGNLVVLQLGDGSAALGSGTVPVFLKEYTTTAGQTNTVSSVAIPLTGPARLTIGGSATSEGQLTLSTDSLKLLVAGYDTSTTTASVNSLSAAILPRVADTLSYLGLPGRAVSTSTAYGGNNIRSIARGTGENYWGSGGSSGTYYLGTAAAPASVQTTVANTRVVMAANGNLYFSTGSGTVGIYKISGQPVAGGTATSLFATGSASQPYAFAINASETVAYVTDDRSVAANTGGIYKWVLNGSVWSATDTLRFGNSTGTRGVAVDWSGTYPVIYATTTDNKLIRWNDSGNFAHYYTVLATAPVNTVFRSVAFAPKPLCTNPVLATTVTNQTCATNGAVTLSITGGTTPNTFAWTGPGPFSAATQNISNLQAGTYTVTATTPGGCSATATAVVINTGTISATATAAGPTTFCVGSGVTLNANTGTGFTYQWHLNGVDITLNGTSASYYASQPGSYTVRVTNGSCSTVSNAVTVVTQPVPIGGIGAGGPVVFCQGGSVILSATPNTSLNYQWKLNGVNIPGATTYSYTANASGSYALTISNSFNTCPNTTSPIVVTVNPLPVAAITPAGAGTICPGGTVALNANTGTGLSYEWRNNGTVISGATGATYNATATGAYKVVVTNANSCRDSSAAKVLTAGTAPAAVITPAGPLAICAGNAFTLHTNNNTGLTYQWKNNGVNVPANGTDSTYTATVTGTYTVVVSAGSGCTATSAAITVSQAPSPATFVTALTQSPICGLDTVRMKVAGTAGATYQWSVNGLAVPGQTDSVLRVPAINTTGNPMAYTIRAIVTSGQGCRDSSAAQSVTVYPAATAIFQPIRDTFCQMATVSIAVTGAGTFSWYFAGTQQTTTVGGNFFLDASVLGKSPAVLVDSLRLVYTNSYGCRDTSGWHRLVFMPDPVPVITYVNGVLSTTVIYDRYQWYRNGVLVQASTTVPTYTPASDGLYNVLATTRFGCSDTAAIAVAVTGLGIHQPAAVPVRLYPNPATGTVHIEAPVRLHVQLCDLTGRVLLEKADTNDLDVSKMGQGIYLLRVLDGDGLPLQTIRLLKQD